MQGEVSILAHSLGSVLCYDILCNQPHLYARLLEKRRQEDPSPERVTSPAGTPAPAGSMQAMQIEDLDPSASGQVRLLGSCAQDAKADKQMRTRGKGGG